MEKKDKYRNLKSKKKEQFFWKKVWNSKTMSRQQTLILRMLNNNCLLVKENITKKKINCNPLCSRCNSRIESINQCFKDCIWATQIWFGSQLIINFKDVKQSFIDWLKDSILTHDEYNTIMIMNIIERKKQKDV